MSTGQMRYNSILRKWIEWKLRNITWNYIIAKIASLRNIANVFFFNII